MSRAIYLRIQRPEGYEDVHPDIVADDFVLGDGTAFSPERVDDEIRRLRISQLRRMASISAGMSDDLFGYASHENAPRGSFLWRMARRKARYVRFRAACLAEIERLRGEG